MGEGKWGAGGSTPTELVVGQNAMSLNPFLFIFFPLLPQRKPIPGPARLDGGANGRGRSLIAPQVHLLDSYKS